MHFARGFLGLDQVLHEVLHIIEQFVFNVESFLALLHDKLLKFIVVVDLRNAVAYLVDVALLLLLMRTQATVPLVTQVIMLFLLLEPSPIHRGHDATLDDFGEIANLLFLEIFQSMIVRHLALWVSPLTYDLLHQDPVGSTLEPLG